VLDAEWTRHSSRLGMLVRYADDVVVLCASRARAEEAHRRVAASLAKVGLVLHPDKTRIVCLTRGAEGFDFLGFHHHKVESWKRRGRFHLQRWPSAKAMASTRAKVWEVTHRRFLDQAVGDIVVVVNRVLRGWGAYFRWGNSAAKFAAVDRYVHERLAIFASNKHGRRGRNWASRYDGRWLRGLGVHRLTGTVRYETAHA
jgi:hypothetical protein